jgi:hypothetical protein
MWLQSLSRKDNAKANYVSTGAVSNIVKGWQDNIGVDLASGLRELYGLLKREGLSVAQCAIGFRVIKLFSNQGIDAETAEYFIVDLYKEFKSRGITPNLIVTLAEDLIKLPENMRLPEIKGYVEEKIAQNKELVDEREQLTHSIAALKVEYSELKKSYDLTLEQKRKDEEELKSYSSSKLILDQYGISITKDISKFTSTVKCIAEFGYDPETVLMEFNDIQYYNDKRRALVIVADEKQRENARLDGLNSSLQHEISMRAQTLSVYNELDNIGFGPLELKRLLDTIIDIMDKNNIHIAVDKFIKDIQTQYDSKLGFESENERLNIQNRILEEEREKRLENITVQPFVGPIITRLLQLGLKENNIFKFAEVYLKLLNGHFPVQDIAHGMLKTVEAITTSQTGTSSDDKLSEILGNVHEELSKLDYS